MNKKDFKQIIKRDLLPLKLSLLEDKQKLIQLKNATSSYKVESYLDRYLLSITDIFFKLNSILVNIKYKILENKGKTKSKDVVIRINEVFGKNNSNNILSLLTFIENNSNIKFDKDFIFYSVIIETLVRHQYSHGFGKSLLYMLDANENEFALFHNEEKWQRYVEEEGNHNAFFMIASTYLGLYDYMDCSHFGAYPSLLLNSVSGRKIAQFKSIQKQQDPNFNNFLLKKLKGNNLKTEIILYKYNEFWKENYYNCIKLIENHYNTIICIINDSTNSEDYKITGINKYEYAIRLNFKYLLMFPYNLNCKHKSEEKNTCLVCGIHLRLKKENITNGLLYRGRVEEEFSKINKKYCKKIFGEIIINKIENINKEIKAEQYKFNLKILT
jgi:hypothetical protein